MNSPKNNVLVVGSPQGATVAYTTQILRYFSGCPDEIGKSHIPSQRGVVP